MPSLAMFVYDLSATGVVRNALALAAHMQEAGWEVILVTCRPGGELAAQAAGLAHVCLYDAPRRRGPRGIDLARAIPRLRRTIRRLAPDILLSAGNHAHLPCCLALRGLHRPLRVYRISNDLSHGRAPTQATLRRLGTRMLVGDAARLVLVSPALTGDPVFTGAAARSKITVIANGVDVGQVRRLAAAEGEALPWPADGDPVVLAVGRLAGQKNFATLVDAVALTSRARPLRLVILGRGSAAARAELIARAHAAGFADRLALPEPVANPFAAMAAAAVVAVPSLWEGAPNVLLEALAVGTPVVAARTAGNAAAILDEGRHGVLVDPLDVPGMAAAVLRQADPATRILPGGRAEAFDRRIALEQYRQVFQALAERERGGPGGKT